MQKQKINKTAKSNEQIKKQQQLPEEYQQVEPSIQKKIKINDKTYYQLPKIQVMKKDLMAFLNQSKLQNYHQALSELSKEFGQIFQQKALPKMMEAVLNTDQYFKKSLPIILTQDSRESVNLTRRQIFCLMSNAFFDQLNVEPRLNLSFPCTFIELMTNKPFRVEKLKAILHYFTVAIIDDSVITIDRLQFKTEYHLKKFFGDTKETSLNENVWLQSKQDLCEVILKNTGKIEDEKNAIIVDFADKNIGGGVLAHGCVQEEILFLMNTEAIASKISLLLQYFYLGIFVSSLLKEDEALLISGIQQYSNYEGYGKSYKFLPQKGPKDNNQIILAIDAKNYGRKKLGLQWETQQILRDLNKAFIGFSLSEKTIKQFENYNLSTGRWGCGIFRGNPQLKFLLQWIAFSQSKFNQNSNAKFIFYPFGDTKLDRINEVIQSVRNRLKVGQLFEIIIKYGANFDSQTLSLFDTLLKS